MTDERAGVGADREGTAGLDRSGGTAGFRAFLLSDIRGYSSFSEARGDEAAAALTERFIAVGGRVIGGFGGESLGNRGDEVLFAFESPRQAIRAAVAFGRALLDATREDPSLPMPAGVGIDVGEAVMVSDGWRANAINVAARLCSLAQGGEILATREVVHLAQAIDGIGYVPRPAVQVKGIAQPVNPVRVVAEGGDTARGFAELGLSYAGAQPAHRRPRLRLLIAAAAVVVLGAVVAVAVTLAGSGTSAVLVAPNSVAVIDPANNQVVAQVSVGSEPEGLAAGADLVWVANTGDHTISEIDVASRQLVHTLSDFGYPVDGVAADSRALWAVSSTRDVAQRIDPTFGTPVSTVKLAPVSAVSGLPSSPTAATVAGGSAWFGVSTAQVVRVGPNDAIVSRVDVGNRPSGIAVGAGATWVSDALDDTVSRIGPTGVSTPPINVGRGASGIAVGDRAVWVTDTLDDTLIRIDPATNSVTTTILVGRSPAGVAWLDGSVWVANSGDGTISRVDPRSSRVTATIAVGQSPQALVAADGMLWVSVQASPPALPSAQSPAGVLRVLRERPFQTLDPPAQGGADVDESQLFYATCAGLLSYPDRPGAQGERLVPDVAQALPTVSADGRTYTFTLRHGFRFSPPSNGASVTAATFKHTIERALNPHVSGYASRFMGDIVGFPAYEAGRAQHLAGVIARGDTLQIRLTARAPDLPARLATPSFCAVPDDTPNRPQSQTIPTAGPYYVASSTPSRLVLARNPNYGGHRPRVPREIVYSFGTKFVTAVNEVAAGKSDYVSAFQAALDPSVPAWLFAGLERRYGIIAQAARTGHQRYFVNPTLSLNSLVLNTTRPLFASTRLRQAVNYAIDRQQLAAIAGPFFGGQPISHYLPPGMPGSRPGSVYPLGAPDLAKARRLAAGVHAHAEMYTCNLAVCTQIAQLVQRELAEIGIPVDIRSMSINALLTRLGRHGEPWDIGWQDWQGEYADPSDFMTALFDPALGYDFGRFNQPAWITRIRQARTLTGEARLQTYGQLDDQLASRAAPIVAWSTGAALDFFGPRVGCEIYQPIYGMDLGRLCLRR
jgi:peptide/nickel transport system substrate-binding protein